MPDLGFNCRTERDKWRAGGVVPTAPLLVDVGPGSYNVKAGSPAADGKPGYAPFLSTAERKLGPDTAAADLPGPGHYSANPAPRGGGQSGRPSDVFRSGTSRFRPPHGGRDANDTPGPGTYLGQGEFGSRDQGMSGNFKGESSDRIKWVRVPTAPSIPGREQSYGYEEGDQGELVMQRPVELGHSGRGDDRPGPVDYQPRVDFTRRCPAAIDFSKGEDRLVALNKGRASTTPGPGHYNATRGLGDPDDGLDIGRAIHRKRRRPTASFHYGTKRDRPRESQPAPGPGDYKVPSGLDVRRDPGRKDLSFLSTSRRFDAPATGGGSRAPGPGSYVPTLSDFDRCRAAVNGRARTRRGCFTSPVGFSSTTLRFAGDSRKDSSELGPATYSVSGMAEEISRRGAASGRKVGAFGSTARRFPARGAGQPNLPGPGAYDLGVGVGTESEEGRNSRQSAPVGPGGKRLPSALSAFASATKRFASPSSAIPGPAPGQYEIRPLEKPKGVLPLGKQSKNRFEGDKAAGPPGLGPGSYNVRDIEQLGRARSRKNIMISSQARFTDPSTPKANNPGPGYYSTGMVYGNLLKQTYNIAIAEQSADI